MSKKLKEKDTNLYDNDLVSMIDEKLTNTQPDVRSSMQEDDEDQNLQQAYSELNIQGYITNSGDTTRVAKAKKPAGVVRTKPNIAPNPFTKQEQPTEQLQTYNDVVDFEDVTPQMDIRPYIPVPAKKSKKRFKLWLISGICAFALLASATLMGIFGLGAGAGSNAFTRNNVETGDLSSQQGIINQTDSNLTDAELTDWLSGRNVPKNISNHDISNNTASQEIPSSSVWDKVCDFFSRLFGR